jgi:hypothetical protein
MTQVNSDAKATNGVATVEDRFTSVAAFRSAHNELLKRYREAGTAPAVLDQIQVCVDRGRRTGALLDSDGDRWTAQSLLDYWTAVLYRAGREPSGTVLDEFDHELAPALPDELCPYLGLEAFTEPRRQLFFGRQRLLDELLKCLGEARLLAVVGSSGSGKSSLVLAGLVPALKADALPGSATWRYLPTVLPGSEPLVNLARAFAHRPGISDDELQGHASELLRDPAYILRLANGSAVPIVVVVDQFEELFTLTRDDAVRRAFAASLLALSTAAGPRHTAIVTMRSDFETQVATLPEFQDAFERGQFRVTPLSASELREAIERPATLVGLKFEEGLVDLLVKEILGEPAGLPLLQFTLLKLWQMRERNRVTLDAYRRLGGGRLALARSADDFYASLIPEEQVTARRILLRMVRPGEGLEVTSSRIRRELLHGDEPRERVDRVLDKLIAARLIRQTECDRVGDVQVEVAHEALVRNWPTLVRWLDDERTAMRQRLRLTAAAEQWKSHGRDPGGLLGGSLLDEATRYPDLNPLEREFVRASTEAVQQARQAEEVAQQRQLEQAQALAREQKQRARQLLGSLIAVSVLLAVTIAAALVAFWQMRQAQEERASTETARALAEKARTAAEYSRTEANARTRELESALKSEQALREQRDNLDQSLQRWRNEVWTSGDQKLRAKYKELVALSTLVRLTASSVPVSGRDNYYTFTLAVTGSEEAMNRIALAAYEFNHPTFQQKLQRSSDRSSGFSVSYVGWGCLRSVIVTLQPVDRAEKAEKIDFNMCEALTQSAQPKFEGRSKGVEGVALAAQSRTKQP